MAWVRRLVARLGAFLRPDRAERELARELAAHLALIEEDHQRRGLSPEEARRRARLQLGGVEQTKEIHREQRSFPWLEDLRRDVPYAIRGLKRSRGLALAAVSTLALGIGAATAVFSLVSTILLRPLPYRDSDRLVQIAENIVRDGPAGRSYSRRFGMTQAEFLEWRARATTFSQMAGVINLMNGSLQTPEGPVAAPRAIVSPVLFEMLGVPPQLGRTLVAADERPAAEAAVISAEAWHRFWGADPAALGRSITLNGTPFTIVGVMPPGFDFPERSTMFWTALAPRPGAGTNMFGNAVAKLKEGVPISVATEEANAIGSALRTAPPRVGYGSQSSPPAEVTPTLGGQLRRELDLAGRPRFEVIGVKELMVGTIRPQLRILVLAVIVVLLIACANVANLLLARARTREREMAVRLSLGASRGRIIRQIVTESAVLSTAGGVMAIAVGVGAVRLVKELASIDTPRLFQLSINLGDGSLLPRISELGVDGGLIVSALVIAWAASFIVGLAPALQVSRPRLGGAIHVGAFRLTGSQPGGGVLRNLLVLAQVMMAATLLIGAGLLVHSFLKLQTLDPGYDGRNVVTFQLTFPPQTPGSRQWSVIEQVISRFQADPHVASVGYTNIPPFLAVTEYGGLFVPPGATREDMLEDPMRPQLRIVSHTYLQTIGARLLAGRWLTEADSGGAQPPVFVVNRALVRRYFGGKNPVGTLPRVYRSPDYIETWQIVGVVEDMKQARLDQEAFPILFADARQVLAAKEHMPKALQIGQALSGFPTIVLRASSLRDGAVANVRAVVRKIDPSLGVGSATDLESLRYGSLVRPRFYAVLVGVFAAIAGILAIVGIYGVLSYTVVQRTQEIGIRLALGAPRGAVLAEVLRRGLTPAILGMGMGLAMAVGLTRYLTSMLYGLTPLDAGTYAAVSLLFVGVAALACYVPARRATKVDPLIALRYE